ncbi:hssA/2C/7E family protein [Dictyostelium discoideum AX4]|uniref:HssA/B-like protein 31 n=1 Tax=Dictyostelium discoideum TaxID=44689 RepID=HSL31_DICDI|nr:hssA/2C/7E family protein [Dictyostelium discoideum AX4]Q54XL1.2 RecName: Full=HssA/B-like protein 31 [Dictyostelium discoideum]EAL68077.2 hssA/2C/7E family protein [Dictyostelium discoideum AX4]|eukprot:XP_647792.2 hssA/2C/7E family protein [Dictyostelium discoideum AX4]
MTIFSTISSMSNVSSSSKSKISLMANSNGGQSLNNISCGGCGGSSSGGIVYTGPSGRSYTLPELIAVGVAHTKAFLMGASGSGNCSC